MTDQPFLCPLLKKKSRRQNGEETVFEEEFQHCKGPKCQWFVDHPGSDTLDSGCSVALVAMVLQNFQTKGVNTIEAI